MIDKLIKLLVNYKYKKEQFYAWSWGIDEHIDIYIMSEESYPDTHRIGLKEEYFDYKDQKWKVKR